MHFSDLLELISIDNFFLTRLYLRASCTALSLVLATTHQVTWVRWVRWVIWVRWVRWYEMGEMEPLPLSMFLCDAKAKAICIQFISFSSYRPLFYIQVHFWMLTQSNTTRLTLGSDTTSAHIGAHPGPMEVPMPILCIETFLCIGTFFCIWTLGHVTFSLALPLVDDINMLARLTGFLYEQWNMESVFGQFL